MLEHLSSGLASCVKTQFLSVQSRLNIRCAQAHNCINRTVIAAAIRAAGMEHKVSLVVKELQTATLWPAFTNSSKETPPRTGQKAFPLLKYQNATIGAGFPNTGCARIKMHLPWIRSDLQAPARHCTKDEHKSFCIKLASECDSGIQPATSCSAPEPHSQHNPNSPWSKEGARHSAITSVVGTICRFTLDWVHEVSPMEMCWRFRF